MKNSLAFMSGRAYHAILSLLAIRLIAQYLKLAGFGEYAVIMAVCTIFVVITDMGTSTICIREMSRDLSKANDIFWAGLLLKFFLGLFSFGCIALAINLMSNNVERISATYIAAIAVILLFIGDIFHAVFIAFERMGCSAVLISIQMTSYVLFLFLSIQLDMGLHGIFGALLLSYGIRILIGTVILFRKFFKPSPHLNLSFFSLG
jgi:O-antigen/teichoic acid export membrane protein